MKQQTFSFYACVVAAVLLTVGAGLVQGHLRQRWGGPDDKAAILEQLVEVPTNFGDWTRVNDHELGEVARATLQCYGHLGRTYRNERTGEYVSLSMIAGPPGPTSVHTPEICMGSQEYKSQKPRQELMISGREDRFWNVTFQSTDVEARQVRVVYGWKCDGPWIAAEQPRITFGWRPYLYKLQASCVGDEATTREACHSFLNDLLHALENAPTQ